MSFLPSIPGNIFAAVLHPFCVWTCGISEHRNSTLQVSKEASAMPIYAMPWYYKLCFTNLHTSPFQSMPGQATILLVYSAVLPSTNVSSDDRYLSKVLGSLIYAVSKCSYLIFCIGTYNTLIHTHYQIPVLAGEQQLPLLSFQSLLLWEGRLDACWKEYFFLERVPSPSLEGSRCMLLHKIVLEHLPA